MTQRLTLFAVAMITIALLAVDVSAAGSDKLAYMQFIDGNWQVFVKPVDGEARQLTTSPYDKSTISWLEDGKHLYVCGVQSESEIINIENGESKPVELPMPGINDAVISPDGELLLFSHIASDSVDNKLWKYNIASGENTPLVVKQKGRQFDPRWNPKADGYYFVTGSATDAYGISKASIASSRVIPVITEVNFNLDPDVSLDNHLAWSSNQSGNYDIWLHVDNTHIRITQHQSLDARPSFNKLGGTVYFESLRSGVSNIWAIDINHEGRPKGEARQVTNSDDGARYPVVFKRTRDEATR